MGAIAGLFHPGIAKPVDPTRVAQMTAALAHRGPDGEWVWTAPGVGLGHRRLATFDAAGPPQPLHDGALSVTMDGAIYNVNAVRGELATAGARFRTDGDTEVLLHGWRAWGPGLLDRLDGAFAFALHDADAQSLFLARDRLGEKPLHYVELADGAVAFASELKGLLAHPLVRRMPDLRAVEDYLAWGYVPDDACIVAGVRKLAAGHWLLLERGRGVPAARRWWQPAFGERTRGSTRVLAAALADRLTSAVRHRIVADVPVGALLSDGVGSAAVVASMAGASPRAVQAFTVGAAHDRAAAVAQRFRAEHHVLEIGDDLAGIDPLVRAFDEPFANPLALGAYQAAMFARRTVTIALSGAGTDEALAAHPRHRFHHRAALSRRLMPLGMRAALGTLGAWYPGAGRAALIALAAGNDEAYARAVAITPADLRVRLLSRAARHELAGYRAEDGWIAAMREASGCDALDRAHHVDLTRGVPGGLLTMIDRTAMAVGLDVRVPMLDHHLVSFAATLPAALRAGEGRLLRRALAPYLPRDMLGRRERNDPAAVDRLRSRLADEAIALSRSDILADTGWFDRTVLADLAVHHRAGRVDHGRTLWQLMMLERSLRSLFA